MDDALRCISLRASFLLGLNRNILYYVHLDRSYSPHRQGGVKIIKKSLIIVIRTIFAQNHANLQ